MPTGYTSDLYEGEQSFPDFVLSCARAFGALITMRDEPADAEIPDEFKPSDYHTKEIEKAEVNLARVSAWSDEEAEADARANYDEAQRVRREYERTCQQRVERYGAMLDAVEGWHPPTPEHVGLRDFMVEQLTTSIKHDSAGTWNLPTWRSGAEHRAERIEKYRKDIAYHQAEHAKEVERAASRTNWVRALRDSLRAGVTPQDGRR